VPTVTIAGRLHTAITAAPVPPRCRSAWRAEARSKQLTGSLGHSGPPASLLSWVRKGLGSHGLPRHPRTCPQSLAGAAALAELSMSPAGSR